MNSSILKKSGVLLLVVLIVLQFIRPNWNVGISKGENDITKAVPISPEIAKMLEKSCYDCHSNNTVYPWYTEIQPIGLWIHHHVTEAKEELNFTEFKTYSAKRQAHKMEEIAEQLQEGEMPLESYTFIHKDVVLTEAEKSTLIAWAKANHALLKSGGTKPAEATLPEGEKEEHEGGHEDKN